MNLLKAYRELEQHLCRRDQWPEFIRGSKLYAASRYKGEVKELIVRCKKSHFNALPHLERVWIDRIIDHWIPFFKEHKIHDIVPVPSNPWRVLIQSSLSDYMAERIARALCVPVNRRLLQRRFFANGQVVKSQKLLDRSTRMSNCLGFKLRRESPKNHLVVDDLLVTGQSLGQAIALLKTHRHRVPMAFVLARAQLL